MERLSSHQQESPVGRILDQCMLERVGRAGRRALAEHKLRIDELAERRVQLGRWHGRYRGQQLV